MNIVFLLIPLGMGLMVAAVVALFWAVNSGQYDELEDASRTVLDPEASSSELSVERKQG